MYLSVCLSILYLSLSYLILSIDLSIDLSIYLSQYFTIIVVVML